MKIKKIPDDFEDFKQLSVFDPEKFRNIDLESYEVGIIGDILLKDNENKVLQLHPKFSIMETSVRGGLTLTRRLCMQK